jgi:hypothetical protein
MALKQSDLRRHFPVELRASAEARYIVADTSAL